MGNIIGDLKAVDCMISYEKVLYLRHWTEAYRINAYSEWGTGTSVCSIPRTANFKSC